MQWWGGQGGGGERGPRPEEDGGGGAVEFRSQCGWMYRLVDAASSRWEARRTIFGGCRGDERLPGLTLFIHSHK